MIFTTFFDFVRRVILEGALGSLEVTSGAIFSSLLLGDGLEMAPMVQNKIKVTGMLYFFVISGFHFSMLRGYFQQIFSFLRFSSKVQQLSVLLCLFLFAGVVGFSIPIIRTLVMYSYGIVGKLLRRQTSVKVIFLGMVVFVCLVAPFQKAPTLMSVSFLLSFGAVFALLFGLAKQTVGTVWQSFWRQCLTSLAVNTVLAPLLLYFFGVWNPVSILFSVLFSPVIGILVGSGFLFLAWEAGLKLVFPFSEGATLVLGSAFSFLVWVFTLLLEVAERVSLEVRVPFSLFHLLLYYGLLFGIVVLYRIKKRSHETVFL